ncbi:mucosa-associated lymphoid tissue lymphoma translocation protein 1 homolog [Argonauta hians]
MDNNNNSCLNHNIQTLSWKIMSSIQQSLNNEETPDNWQRFVEALSTLNFPISTFQFKKILFEGNKPGKNVAQEMFNYLSPKAFTVHHLLQLLDLLRMETHVNTLRNLAQIPREPVRIVRQPKEVKGLKEGDILCLDVAATGFPYPRYQWFKDDDVINGATQSELLIGNISVEDEGNYSCRIHNSRTSVILSRIIPISVFSFKITQSSPSQLLQVGDRLSLWCHARNNRSTLFYKWFKDGALVANSNNYTKEKVNHQDTGIYRCEVTSVEGSIYSDNIVITVTPHTLVIVTQPKFTLVQLNGVALFLCEAKGPQEVKYQWYKDGVILPNATKPELKVQVNNASFQGMYHCVVACLHLACTSDTACLQITSSAPKNISRPICEATDKIALLIANEEYRSEKRLRMATKDVKLLSSIFQKLSFKVISLSNLTLTEMKMAVYRYIELLNNGVYGVFYYAGHGFETSSDPYSYLLPVDAPTGANISHCLSAQKIQQVMLERNPALCCLILDICRSICTDTKYYSAPIKLRENRSSVYMYATTRGNSAFEPPHGALGDFVNILKEYLYTEDTIDEMFGKVRQALGNQLEKFEGHSNYQNPEIRSNLSNIHISLSDRINTTNHTQEYNMRAHLWEQANILPRKMFIEITVFRVRLKIEFTMEFSNVMFITVSVEDSGIVPDCYAWIVQIPSTLTADKATILQPDKKKIRTCVRDLQKLQSDMEVGLKFVYTDKCGETKSCMETLNLSLPMASNLHLWKLSTDMLETELIEKK